MTNIRVPNYKPSRWQKDPQQVTASAIIVWTSLDRRVTDKVSQEAARNLVRAGLAYVVTDSAIRIVRQPAPRPAEGGKQ